MAYDYKPGEDDSYLKKSLMVATALVVIAAIVVIILYTGLGIDMDMLKILVKKFRLDAANLTFLFGFIMCLIALWGVFRDAAATEGVERRQGYFILLLLLAGALIAGTFYFKRFTRPTHEIVTTEICPRCLGSGRAKLRPEYPCGECDGVGTISP